MADSDSNSDSTSRLPEFPSFDLSYVLDEDEHPAQVTVYSDVEDEHLTHWITVSVELTVDLGQMR